MPGEAKALALLVAREHTNVHASTQLNANATFRLLDRCDAIRRPERFRAMLKACEHDARGRLGMQDRPYPQHGRLAAALDAALGADVASAAKRVMAAGSSGRAIGAAVKAARVRSIASALESGAVSA